MAPAHLAPDAGLTTPLADYFFIAGIESSQVTEEKVHPNGLASPPPEPVDETIEENEVLETDANVLPKSGEGLNGYESPKRRSNRFSFEARKSISSILGSESKTASNRSSATIKAVPSEIAEEVGGSGLSDADFEVALKKFASERDSFLEEIQFSAGVIPQPPSKPKQRPKTQRIISDDSQGGGLMTGVGSIRRRLSTMSSLKKQPSVMRQCKSTCKHPPFQQREEHLPPVFEDGLRYWPYDLSGRPIYPRSHQDDIQDKSSSQESLASVRTSKRMSGYNSVIPAPQPFHIDPNMHPLKRRYEPVLLDRYPPRNMHDELKRRNSFPDYVPMFAFPNDVNVVSADERPRSTWHGFAMTNADGSSLHGMCLIIWVPLNPAAAEDLERQCEIWRQANLSPEERELAASLGERLAKERAQLSSLLGLLPTVPQGSEEREQLDEKISIVEEKIGLMTDMLRPVRHGAASKIEGLTDGETGLWIPRAFGVLGRDGALTSFWKEWLKAIVVPMMNGGILRVPPSSPKVGFWQPLERWVVNLCAEAFAPKTSMTQVEISIRELRLYARKEALNELPGSRNVDLYPLFRTLTLSNVITLFEYALAESRIILLSSHTSMLQLASAALMNLLYPLRWRHVFIPVLPARLIGTLEAPCPYIVGIERRYENVDLPDDDFVLVDLDNNTIESFGPPASLPRQVRRKLMSLLQLAAPHHNRYGVDLGPPLYAKDAFPHDSYVSEHASIYTHKPPSSTLATLVGLNSASFGHIENLGASRTLIFNAFLQATSHSRGSDQRPATSSTGSHSRLTSPPSPKQSPVSGTFPSPSTPNSRSDSAFGSGFSLQQNLREKRSGLFDSASQRRSSSVSFRKQVLIRNWSLNFSLQFHIDRAPTARRPSQPLLGHVQSNSTSNFGESRSGYAPSVYAQSTLAASTVMPNMMMQPVKNTETQCWVEGHCLQWRAFDQSITCLICEEKADEGIYRCTSCSVAVHGRCKQNICLVCPSAFRPDQVRAAFVRCFASILYTYRRCLQPASGEQKKNGMIYTFHMDAFLKSVPHETAEYITMMQQTQGFNEFIHECETRRADDPQIRLFDQIIVSKKNRGHRSLFSKGSTDFLSDASEHIWRTASAMPPSSRFPGDYRQVVSRVPASLDPALMKEPRAIQGVPRLPPVKQRRKPIPSMLAADC